MYIHLLTNALLNFSLFLPFKIPTHDTDHADVRIILFVYKNIFNSNK